MNHAERTEINAMHHKIARLEETIEGQGELIQALADIVQALITRVKDNEESILKSLDMAGDRIKELQEIAHYHSGMNDDNQKT